RGIPRRPRQDHRGGSTPALGAQNSVGAENAVTHATCTYSCTSPPSRVENPLLAVALRAARPPTRSWPRWPTPHQLHQLRRHRWIVPARSSGEASDQRGEHHFGPPQVPGTATPTPLSVTASPRAVGGEGAVWVRRAQLRRWDP